eukprot:Skav235236  [mRNA]  locus=scaffold3995:238370:240690:+ [translate_table: standard]
MSLLVEPKELIVKKELCTTCKSIVSIASWNGKLVAAKQLKMDLEQDGESREIVLKDLLSEISILSDISHPCLVKLLGANLGSAGPLMVTELLENQDVETVCKILQVVLFGSPQVETWRRNDRAPKMSGGVGTWRYMAPEVVRYEQYDEKIDIYAFALIMYFIFSGRQCLWHSSEQHTAGPMQFGVCHCA